MTPEQGVLEAFREVMAELHPGYDWLPAELAGSEPAPAEARQIVGSLAAHPYVVNAQRRPEGRPAQRYDQLKHALRGGEDLERFAVLGHAARKGGWTPEEGWPT